VDKASRGPKKLINTACSMRSANLPTCFAAFANRLVPNIERNKVCNATTKLLEHRSQLVWLVCTLVDTGSMVTCALALPSRISASSSSTLCMVGEEYDFFQDKEEKKRPLKQKKRPVSTAYNVQKLWMCDSSMGCTVF
jgi:hypothetical protein